MEQPFSLKMIDDNLVLEEEAVKIKSIAKRAQLQIRHSIIGQRGEVMLELSRVAPHEWEFVYPAIYDDLMMGILRDEFNQRHRKEIAIGKGGADLAE